VPGWWFYNSQTNAPADDNKKGYSVKFNAILLDITDSVATITLNRPDKLNAFTAEMHAELKVAMQTIQSDASVRVLMITGAGRGFCAGQDLSERMMSDEKDPPDVGSSLDKNYNPLLKALRALPYPVICAVNGVAAGAGCNLVLACDIVIAARSASFIQAFSRIGLIPDAGGTYTLPRLVGTARAMAAAMLAEKISAEQAQQWGMIWKCVDDDKLVTESTTLVRQLAGQATKALGLMKRAIYASSDNTFAQQLDLERDLQREAGKSTDFREGVAAFHEKRPAKFTGR
jgi:2-(1,2-epoxy-1,2-dihydrophenyl)acetyl-CoA isomerase